MNKRHQSRYPTRVNILKVIHADPADGGEMTGRQINILIYVLGLYFVGLPPLSYCAPWQGTIRIALAAAPGEHGLQVVRGAIDFWNTTLQESGISLRLGEAKMIQLPKINQQLTTMSAEKLKHHEALILPSFLEDIDADLLIILTDLDIVSFTEHWQERSKALVAIKSEHLPPLSMPNVRRNVIAHELGHVIGLEHNPNPAALMCGRPAACRPEEFSSPAPFFFPLTEEEKQLLRTLYAN